MKKSKGMLTLEAALVMPLVIYTVFIMIFTFLFIYTRVYVLLSTNYVMAQATAQWYSVGSDFDSTKEGGSVIGQALGMALSTSKKEKIIEEKIRTKVDDGSPMKVDLKVNVNTSNYIIGQRLHIKVKGKYKLPLSGIFKIMGLTKDGTITDTYKRTLNLANAEDNIRTVTYVSKLVNKNIDSVLGAIENAFLGGE